MKSQQKLEPKKKWIRQINWSCHKNWSCQKIARIQGLHHVRSEPRANWCFFASPIQTLIHNSARLWSLQALYKPIPGSRKLFTCKIQKAWGLQFLCQRQFLWGLHFFGNQIFLATPIFQAIHAYKVQNFAQFRLLVRVQKPCKVEEG